MVSGGRYLAPVLAHPPRNTASTSESTIDPILILIPFFLGCRILLFLRCRHQPQDEVNDGSEKSNHLSLI